MSVVFVATERVVGGHMLMTTLMPRLVDGTIISLRFDGIESYPERITASTPNGQFAGHLNLPLAEVIYASRQKVVSMSAVCRETSHRRPEGWAVEVSYTITS